MKHNNYRNSGGFRSPGASAQGWARALLPSKTQDVALVDIHMPQMNGLEMCEAIRANSEMQGIPVVMVSAAIDARTVFKERVSCQG